MLQKLSYSTQATTFWSRQCYSHSYFIDKELVLREDSSSPKATQQQRKLGLEPWKSGFRARALLLRDCLPPICTRLHGLLGLAKNDEWMAKISIFRLLGTGSLSPVSRKCSSMSHREQKEAAEILTITSNKLVLKYLLTMTAFVLTRCCLKVQYILQIKVSYSGWGWEEAVQTWTLTQWWPPEAVPWKH